MKAILILAGPYSSCKATELMWEEACRTENIELETFDLTHTEGQNLSSQLKVKSFPALIVDNKVIAVGHPNKKAALKIIQSIE